MVFLKNCLHPEAVTFTRHLISIQKILITPQISRVLRSMYHEARKGEYVVHTLYTINHSITYNIKICVTNTNNLIRIVFKNLKH